MVGEAQAAGYRQRPAVPGPRIDVVVLALQLCQHHPRRYDPAIFERLADEVQTSGNVDGG